MFELPAELQELSKICNVLKEFRFEVPVNIDINSMELKVGIKEGWEYSVSVHWEFWGPDDKIHDETVNKFYVIPSGKNVVLSQNIQGKADVTRITLLVIIYIAECLPVEILNIDT